MSLDRAVTLFAGFMVLLSLALTHWVHPAWVWLTVFVGFNLMQSSFTGFCPAAKIMQRLGVRPGPTIRAVQPTPVSRDVGSGPATPL
ncbi:DUF2892 domain-containing protein [Brevundimonas sp.]|uniref:YgaP family membrane protein n=1 Tax=Brevundimonas sp. TaxID=1871086 RepID=UPI0027EB76C3|nr:DUF2892 domain-containing protein [Brevundimonas sp.]MDQ7812125.1 DUF2892 domain-containing protein [Brevundimonas sp.]